MNEVEVLALKYCGKMCSGYCEGGFGRDGYGDKRIEAVGADWVVVRYVDEDPTCTDHCHFKDTDQMRRRLDRWIKGD